MQNLKTLLLLAILAVVAISTSISLKRYYNHGVEQMDQTRALRSRMQERIHEDIQQRYNGSILDSRMVSRCGITVYTVTMQDNNGKHLTLLYNIDTGAPVQDSVLNGCKDF